jgi:hypothetical protein
MNFNLSVNRAPCSSPCYLVTPESAAEVVEHVLSGGECLIEVLPFHGTGAMYPRRVEQMKRDSNGEWWFGVQLWCFQWFQFPSAGLQWTLIGSR